MRYDILNFEKCVAKKWGPPPSVLSPVWIPRLLTQGKKNWKTVPDYYLGKLGGLNFLLRCNYDVKYLQGLPAVYKDILAHFKELKIL